MATSRTSMARTRLVFCGAPRGSRVPQVAQKCLEQARFGFQGRKKAFR